MQNKLQPSEFCFALNGKELKIIFSEGCLLYSQKYKLYFSSRAGFSESLLLPNTDKYFFFYVVVLYKLSKSTREVYEMLSGLIFGEAKIPIYT